MCLEHLAPIREAVRERLGFLHSVAELLVLEARPDASTAGHREEPHLAIASPAPEEFEHRLRIGTGEPFGFGHLAHLGRRRTVASISNLRAVTKKCGAHQ